LSLTAKEKEEECCFHIKCWETPLKYQNNIIDI